MRKDKKNREDSNMGERDSLVTQAKINRTRITLEKHGKGQTLEKTKFAWKMISIRGRFFDDRNVIRTKRIEPSKLLSSVKEMR